MSQSQLESNAKDLKSGKRLTQRDVVYNIIKQAKTPLSVNDIKRDTLYRHASIVGRLSEICDEGLIVEHYFNARTYYSLVHNEALTRVLKEKKQKQKTQRILNKVFNDEQAINDLVNVFLIAMTDERELKEAFKSEIKNLIK
jgi:hypothetical protein